MADLLALDWQKHEIIGIEADTGRHRCAVRRCFRVEIPEEMQKETAPQVVGVWLRAQLARQRVTAKQIIVLLPREEVVVRQLQLPQMPDADLPATTRLQLSTRTAVPVDQLAIDFVPISSAATQEGRRVIASSVSKRQLQRLRAIATAADLKLLSVGTSHDGLAAWAHRMEIDQRVSLHEPTFVVHVRQQQLDLLVMCEGEVRFTNSTYLPFVPDADNRQQLFAEIRRCLLTISSTTEFAEMARIWLVGAGDEGTSIAMDWAGRMPGPQYTAFEPFDVSGVTVSDPESVDDSTGTAPLLGSLMAHDKDVVAKVDFLSPRQPPVQQNKTRLNSLIAIAAAVVLIGGFYWWTGSIKAKLDHDIKVKEQELADHQKAIDTGQAEWDSMAEITAWNDKNVNWMRQLSVFDELMAERKPNVYLRQLKVKQGTNSGVAEIDANLLAIDEYSIRHLRTRFGQFGYNVVAQEINREGKESRFPFETLLDLVLVEKPEPLEVAAAGDKTDSGTTKVEKTDAEKKTESEKQSGSATGQPLMAPLPAAEGESAKPEAATTTPAGEDQPAAETETPSTTEPAESEKPADASDTEAKAADEKPAAEKPATEETDSTPAEPSTTPEAATTDESAAESTEESSTVQDSNDVQVEFEAN